MSIETLCDVFDRKYFTTEVARSRGNRSLREFASEVGVSASTLSRVMRGWPPDLETFLRLCEWMGTGATRFMMNYGKDHAT